MAWGRWGGAFVASIFSPHSVHFDVYPVHLDLCSVRIDAIPVGLDVHFVDSRVFRGLDVCLVDSTHIYLVDSTCFT